MNHKPKTSLPWPNDNDEPSFALHCDARDIAYAHHAANCYKIFVEALKASLVESSYHDNDCAMYADETCDCRWKAHNARIDAALAAAGESE